MSFRSLLFFCSITISNLASLDLSTGVTYPVSAHIGLHQDITSSIGVSARTGITIEPFLNSALSINQTPRIQKDIFLHFMPNNSITRIGCYYQGLFLSEIFVSASYSYMFQTSFRNLSSLGVLYLQSDDPNQDVAANTFARFDYHFLSLALGYKHKLGDRTTVRLSAELLKPIFVGVFLRTSNAYEAHKSEAHDLLSTAMNAPLLELFIPAFSISLGYSI